MSLINQMLQDLDARGSDSMRNSMAHAEVRAVPEAHKSYLGWWLALVLAVMSTGAATWLWLRTTNSADSAPRTVAESKIDLKLAPALMTPPATLPPTEAEAPAAPVPDATDGTPVAPVLTENIAPASERQPVTTVPAYDLKNPAEPVSAGEKGASSTSMPLPVPSRLHAGAAPDVEQKPKEITSSSQAEISPQVVASKKIQELSPQLRAENDYRRAASLMANGKAEEAVIVLERALSIYPRHTAARQTLVGLLLDSKRSDDARQRLREGLAVDSNQPGLAMILARLQVEDGDLNTAVESLQRSLAYAAERGDYQSFLAALLQRQGRHGEAIEHYALALRSEPQNALWWMGIAISLQAEHRLQEARDAFGRAKSANTLSPDLQAFVEQRLSQLSR